ncbi:MAG: autoinducer binding domain-containing protein [Paracoccaceae bacterium]
MAAISRLDVLCPAGYAMALHIRYTTPKFLFQTYSSQWREEYSKKGLVLQDPTVSWGFENTGTINWRDLKESDEAGVLEQAKAYGIGHGFTLSLDRNNSKSITSFARGDRDFSAAEIEEISDIVTDLHNYTADIDEFSRVELVQLKQMSVEFTHG